MDSIENGGGSLPWTDIMWDWPSGRCGRRRQKYPLRAVGLGRVDLQSGPESSAGSEGVPISCIHT